MSVAESISPDVFSPDVVYGHRVWRVMPYTELSGRETVRLCAVGTRGIPKVWNPRSPQHAVCSSHQTHHEAPWFDCECGVWASDNSEWAFRRMVMWMQTQGGNPVGWAIGQVALWGRVIEHTKGWRAQYAYPYAVSVHALDENVARAVRLEYAVDVEWAGSELTEKVAKRVARKAAGEAAQRAKLLKEAKQARDDLDALIAEMGERAAKRRTTIRQAGREQSEWQRNRDALEQWAKDNPLPTPPQLTTDDILAGYVAAEAIEEARQIVGWRRRRGIDETACASWLDVDAVAHGLLRLRGVEGPGGHEFDTFRRREHYSEWESAVRVGIAAMIGQGLAEKDFGIINSKSEQRRREVRLTSAGLSAVKHLALPESVKWFHRVNGSCVSDLETADVPLAVGVKLACRRAPFFEHEANAIRDRWQEERKTARRQGRGAYVAWFKRWRVESHRLGVDATLFTEDEVVAALRRVSGRRRRPVSVVELATDIAPGTMVRGEVYRISQILVKARKAQLVTSEKAKVKGKSVLVWGLPSAV